MRHQQLVLCAVMVAGMMSDMPGVAQAGADPVVEAQETMELYLKTDPSLKRFMDTAAGYVVFPSVAKGAAVVGGARGHGVLFQRGGTPIARATMTQVTVGLQAGGQSFSEIIFFENPKALSDFKKGEFSLAAQVSAVALSAGAARSARYQNGVAVFTATTSGLMLEASVGGQKFNVKPLN
jgi:lipid-binding SYLF domain-containing protein